MSLELDDETRAQLGWGANESREDGLRADNHATRSNGTRIAPGDIDGRHKARDRAAMSRAYWERKAQRNSK